MLLFKMKFPISSNPNIAFFFRYKKRWIFNVQKITVLDASFEYFYSVFIFKKKGTTFK